MISLARFFLFSVLVCCAHGGFFTNILVMDCAGGVTFMPDSTIARTQLDVSHVKAAFDFYVERAKERVRCQCPGVTDIEIESTFGFAGSFWLNFLQGHGQDFTLTGCPNGVPYTSFLENFNNTGFEFILPGSCSYSDWIQGKPCFVKAETDKDGSPIPFTLEVAIDHCPNSIWPFVSVTCTGEACSQLGKPCNTDTDCGAPGSRLTCEALRNDQDVNQIAPSAKDFFQYLKDIRVYDSGDAFPGCKPVETIVQSALQFFRTNFDAGVQQEHPAVQFCFPFDVYYENGSGIQSPETVDHFKDQCPSNCDNTTDYCVVSCSFVEEWDGIMPGGEAANSAARKNGQNVLPFTNVAPITPGATVLFHSTCDDQFQILPNHPHLGVNTRFPISSTINYVKNILQEVESCRATVRGDQILSDQSFRNRFGLPDGWLYQLTAPIIPTPPGPAMSDFTLSGITSRLAMPSTCSYGNWITNGECSALYTGLSDLFGVQIEVRGRVKQCPNSQVPEVYFECLGEGCSLLAAPIECSTSGDCATGLICQDLNQWMHEKNFSDYVLGWTVASHFSDQCYGFPSWIKDVRAFMLWLADKTQDGMSTNNYCFVDTNYVPISEWENGQVVTDGDLVTLVKLAPWSIHEDSSATHLMATTTMGLVLYFLVAFM